jgi:hypothetical protein
VGSLRRWLGCRSLSGSHNRHRGRDEPARTDFKPLPESLQKVLDIHKEKMFENSVKRLFYQDKTSKSPADPNAYSASVPGKAGNCSCHVTFLPNVSADMVKKIALSLGPVPQADLPEAQRGLD